LERTFIAGSGFRFGAVLVRFARVMAGAHITFELLSEGGKGLAIFELEVELKVGSSSCRCLL